MITRRSILLSSLGLLAPAGLATSLIGCNQSGVVVSDPPDPAAVDTNSKDEQSNQSNAKNSMKIHYLEIVTPDVEAICSQYASLQGISFSDPNVHLGGARTATLDNGGTLGVRAPMHDQETPVVRPYVLVEDIKAAVTSAVEAGAKVIVPPMEIPNFGMCAIVVLGGIECGFWQE